MADLEKIAVLDNEIEARLLGSILNEQEIPHMIVSYYDSAFDGVFQVSQGWGHVEAPATRKEEVMLILDDLRSRSDPREGTSD
jgi:hypothetical protein